MDRFADRRDRFLKEIGDGIAVVEAATETVRNNDVHHVFRQDSDFFFLTGFREPESVAVFDPGHDSERFVLFVRPRDPEREAWDGKRAGVEGAKERFGADAAYPLSDLSAKLRERLRGKSALWYDGTDPRVTGALAAARAGRVRSGIPAPDRVQSAAAVLHEMRLVKSAEEIEAMRRACRVSAAAHAEAIRFARPGISEREVQAVLEYVFRSLGSEHDGYPSIVASGPNAVILHYIENDRVMEEGDLLLIDAGAEYDYFSADITRTFPVNGRFGTAQRAVYGVVLAAQEEAIARCRPGTPFSDLHETAVRVLTEGMVDLGLIPGPVDDAVAFGWYRPFYFHGTGHWLGMDVHDAGAYRIDRAGRLLEPAMVFTVEPGLYMAPDKTRLDLHRLEYDAVAETERAYLDGAAAAKEDRERRESEAPAVTHDVPEEFLGIGVRIEDDVLVTAGGHELLTRDVPVDPDEIEALWAEPSVMPRLGG
ncbi:MAG: M24 family metallopeptidase [Actinobacteria bacterium]|nr:MAG: M24 family metallopeptidase [Actinomycetota bacterium]